MNLNQEKLNKLLWKISSNLRFILIFLSLLSFLVIFIQLSLPSSSLFLEFISFCGSAFLILFLPSYPLYFFLIKFQNLTFLERVSVTIVTNLSIYIIEGIFGHFLSIPLTPLYFFFFTLCLYLIFIAMPYFLPSEKIQTDYIDKKIEKYTQGDLSISRFFKTRVSLNHCLLTIFILLFIVLDLIRGGFFVGHDPWLHLSVIRSMTSTFKLPINEYFGAMGLHIFSTIFYYFSGVELLIIPRIYLFYSFPLSSLIAYCLFKRIFRNRNLAIFGVFILSFSSLGFTYLMYQYWPSGFTLIQMLMIFLLLYIRQPIFIKEEPPVYEVIKSEMLQFYIPIVLIFISSLITHSLLTMIILISYLWIYVVLFVTNFRRGFDLFVLLGLVAIFFVFFFFGVSTGHFNVFRYVLGIYPPLIIAFGLIIGAAILIIPLVYLRGHLYFDKHKYDQIISGKDRNLFIRISDKYFFLAVFILGIVFTVSYFILNLLVLNADISFVLVGFELFFFILFALWGIVIFQYKPRGISLWMWFLALTFLVLAGIVFDSLTETLNFFTRILYISSVAIVIGFVSFIYKLIKTGAIEEKITKLIIVILISYSLIASFADVNHSVEFFSLKSHEVNAIDWYSSYTSNNNVIIGQVGWEHVFIYHNYPFGEENETFKGIHVFTYANDDLMIPKNHILENGTNALRQIKRKNNGSSVYIFLLDYYLLPSGESLFGQVTESQLEEYYSLNYLNRIFSAKGESGVNLPIYWVI